MPISQHLSKLGNHCWEFRMGIDEQLVQNKKRVVDMMVSFHSTLRDRYKRRAQVVDILLVVLSIILVTVTFLDPEIPAKLGLDAFLIKVINGLSGVLITVVSIVSMLVDWKGRSVSHESAFRSLLDLKSVWQSLRTGKDESSDDLARLVERTGLVMNSLIPIKDSQFTVLKAKHYRKIALSKLLDESPGMVVWMVMLRIHIRDTLKSMRTLRQDQEKK